MSALHRRTPLLHSPALSRASGSDVRVKLESVQPAGSFKIRGIGHACRTYVERGAAHLVASSGGNAGLAVAHAGRKLGVPVTVVVPESTTERAKELIRQEEAEVIVEGASWNEAHEHALTLMGDDAAYLHPFDDALLWEGHSTIVDEVVEEGVEPEAIVVSVGGGGLFCGVVQGLRRHGWSEVPVVAVETEGTRSLRAALEAGHPAPLGAIASVATSLGAKQVGEQTFTLAQEHPTKSVVVSDDAAVTACIRFLDDHRQLVEPACGAALAVAYDNPEVLSDAGTVVLIACGGAGVTLEKLRQWHGREELPTSREQ
ncbi:MAG: pyridoxal-phosphate dependent enzyme [Salinibacter sp.]|uniref:pyridoxal-phosphate dependent enzyme n=1 Tax=Salinibacter sp. TaxID=2065818 RepID=UPI0035D47554